jgi:hypothetical protein
MQTVHTHNSNEDSSGAVPITTDQPISHSSCICEVSSFCFGARTHIFCTTLVQSSQPELIAVPGTPNFRLIPPSSGGLAQNRRWSYTAAQSGDSSTSGLSGVQTDSDVLERSGQSSATSTAWPQHTTFVFGPSVAPIHSSQASADFSRPSARDAELASVLSPTVSLVGPLSRQMSMASYRSSTALTTAESAYDASKVSVSRLSLVSHERLPLVPDDSLDDLALEAAALRSSLEASQSHPNGVFPPPAAAESPKSFAAGKVRLQGGPVEPGLVEMAEALSRASGAVIYFLLGTYFCFFYKA